MPHENRYNKTRDGYILECETLLKIELPKAYWRTSIEQAEALHQAALFFNSNPWNFIKLARSYNLPVVAKLPAWIPPSDYKPSPAEWRVIRVCMIERLKMLAVAANIYERSGIGTVTAYNEKSKIKEVLGKMEVNFIVSESDCKNIERW